MSSKSIVTRRFGAALVTALVVAVPTFGCASDDEDGTTSEAAASTAASGTGTADEGIDSLEEAQALACSGLSDLEADLTELSAGETEAGADLRARLAVFAAALEGVAESLTTAGAADAATAAETLASDLEALSTASGEDAQARAGEAADGAQQLTDALECR